MGIENRGHEGRRGCDCEEGKLFNGRRGCEVPSWLEGVNNAFSLRGNLLQLPLCFVRFFVA